MICGGYILCCFFYGYVLNMIFIIIDWDISAWQCLPSYWMHLKLRPMLSRMENQVSLDLKPGFHAIDIARNQGLRLLKSTINVDEGLRVISLGVLHCTSVVSSLTHSGLVTLYGDRDLTPPSHYLKQCWLIISEAQWHSYQGNFTRNATTINH